MIKGAIPVVPNTLQYRVLFKVQYSICSVPSFIGSSGVLFVDTWLRTLSNISMDILDIIQFYKNIDTLFSSGATGKYLDQVKWGGYLQLFLIKI